MKPVVENISCIIPESVEKGALYLGNVYGAQNTTILKQYGIRSVLTTSIETPIEYRSQDIPYHLKIEAHDKDDYFITDHLDECIQFIDKCRNHTNVYVHCYAGVSRSATIVCAYLMKMLKWPMLQTLDFIKSKRIVAKPNQGFMEQLKKYQQNIRQFKVSRKASINTQQNLSTHTHLHRREQKKYLAENNNINYKKYTHHNDIPLPKVLMSKTTSRQPTPSNYNLKYQPTYSKEKTLRPKDLPGYLNY